MCQVNGKAEISTPTAPTFFNRSQCNLKPRKISGIRPNMQNLLDVGRREGGLRGEGIFRYFLCSILFLYSRSRLQVTPEDWSRLFMAQNACFHVRYALLGVAMIKNNAWGSKLPKNMILGAWISILSQICEIFESRYVEKYALDQHEIWRGISGAQMDFMGGPALQNYNSYMQNMKQKLNPMWRPPIDGDEWNFAKM